uniref:Holocarboxylase synthetase n=1 Tax=Noccaea caerulescens TaxID=107243 RepID=A0A1J3D083_NOCCA
MGKKRKSTATSLDEVDRTVYASFRTAANSLSQLYTQSMNHQKLSFQAGERHGLEKLYQWIWRQQEGGSRVTSMDIVSYIQNELESCTEEPSMSPRALPHQPTMHVMNAGLVASSGTSFPTAVPVSRSEQCENQAKNSVFSNALSSPIRRSLQNYQIPQGGYISGATRSSEQNRGSNSPGSIDSSMDMHAD